MDDKNCTTCGKPTSGTEKCNNCWEVESRLDNYLKSPKGMELILLKVAFNAGGAFEGFGNEVVQYRKLMGPRCTDTDCLDYDGGHPYHTSELIKRYAAGQKAGREYADLQLKDAEKLAGQEYAELETRYRELYWAVFNALKAAGAPKFHSENDLVEGVQWLAGERDDAVKAKKETEARHERFEILKWEVERLGRRATDMAILSEQHGQERDALRAQVEQMRGALEKSQREEKRLVRELIDLHLDDVQPPSTVEEAEAIMREAGVDPEAFLQRAREHVARVRAALSPSPASGVAAKEPSDG